MHYYEVNPAQKSFVAQIFRGSKCAWSINSQQTRALITGKLILSAIYIHCFLCFFGNEYIKSIKIYWISSIKRLWDRFWHFYVTRIGLNLRVSSFRHTLVAIVVKLHYTVQNKSINIFSNCRYNISGFHWLCNAWRNKEGISTIEFKLDQSLRLYLSDVSFVLDQLT